MRGLDYTNNVNGAVSVKAVTATAFSGLSDVASQKSGVTPRQRAYELCEEIVWWHHAMGTPIKITDVFSRNRERWVASVRGDCIRRVRETFKWSYPRIGKFFGLDHSTCIHHMNHRVATIASPDLTLESARRLMASLLDQMIAEKPERWAIIVGQPKYSIADNGLVRLDDSGNIRRPQVANNGYAYINFQSGPKGRAVYWPVHRMVMEAFVGPCPPGKQIVHVDGDRLNNRLSNLRYGEAKPNGALANDGKGIKTIRAVVLAAKAGGITTNQEENTNV